MEVIQTKTPAEGEDALFSLTTGVNNSATGFDAHYNHTTGVRETVCSLLAGTAQAGDPVGAFLGLSEFFDVPTMRQWKRWLPCVIPI
jgi:hypothetical protein